MQEIEVSSRLRLDGGHLYLTGTFLAKVDTDRPEATPVTFILTDLCLVTLRYADPKPIGRFAEQMRRHPQDFPGAEVILVGLLDAFVDRMADVLENVGAELDALSAEIFGGVDLARTRGAGRPDFSAILRRIGRCQYLASKARESLVTLGRLVIFLARPGELRVQRKLLRSGLKTLTRDVRSLSEQTNFLTNTITFQLDAVLGLINIEQNGIIKIFSVAAVVLLPPAVVASVYGMNFAHMPELDWRFGYLFALALMVLSAILPYWYFKRRGWL
jgi:magnesium transporter